jgi:hypothetical protein
MTRRSKRRSRNQEGHLEADHYRGTWILEIAVDGIDRTVAHGRGPDPDRDIMMTGNMKIVGTEPHLPVRTKTLVATGREVETDVGPTPDLPLDVNTAHLPERHQGVIAHHHDRPLVDTDHALAPHITTREGATIHLHLLVADQPRITIVVIEHSAHVGARLRLRQRRRLLVAAPALQAHSCLEVRPHVHLPFPALPHL